MKREHFVKVVEDALDSLPQEFRSRIRNVAVLVEDMPPNQPSSQSGQQGRLLLGLFLRCPRPRRAYLTYRQGPITSCFIRRILKRSAPARPESANKSASRSSMNWATISGWM